MKNVPPEIVDAGQEAISLYVKLRSNGFTERWAEMCALQQPPGVRGTDRALMQHRLNGQWLDEMPKGQADTILRQAKAAGINVEGKFYMSGLADKRAHRDPAAWVDSVADIKKVAAQRNLTVRGIVDCDGIPQPPPKPKRLSKRLTKEMMRFERQRDPSLKAKKDGEVREMVIEKYGRKHKK